MVERWKFVGEKKSEKNEIREPEEPSKVLIAHIDIVPDRDYPGDPVRQEKVRERRELIRSCAEKIEEIGIELTRAFIDTYARHGLEIKNGARFYIVGGRLEGKPLNEGSDLDCAFTVVDSSESVQPKPGEEPREVYEKKNAARKEFAFTVFDKIVQKHGFMLEEVVSSGETVRGSLLEPKEYGSSDEGFRKKNMPALLVVTVR